CILLRDSDDFLSYHPISGHVNYIVLLSLVCAVCAKLLRSSTQLTWAIVKDTTTHEKEGKLQPIKTFSARKAFRYCPDNSRNHQTE
uniref:Uncharacterized protein n=1 Tax=Glossina palpalis gambiensis TaxID=67801 RepID=A0A1B0ALT4_9MUSC